MKTKFATFLFLFIVIISSCSLGEPLCNSKEGCPSAAPTVNGVSSVPNDNGSATITITGTGFTDGTTVTVNGTPCTDVHVLSSTQLTCVLPDGTIALVNIVVTSPGSGSSNSTTAYHTIFVTAATFTGYFPGFGAGGNTMCRTAALAGSKTSSLTGTWRAVLSYGNNNPIVPLITHASSQISFVSGSSVKNTTGETVVSSGSDLWTGTLLKAVRFDENGTLVDTSNQTVWTGSTSAGIRNGKNCNEDSSAFLDADWHHQQPGYSGTIGDFTSTSATWISNGSGTCNIPRHLYCINSNG